MLGNGANMSHWTPQPKVSASSSRPILKPLEPLRDRVLVVTGLDNWPATDQGDTGGQHSRAAVAFMRAAHRSKPKAPMHAGATVDQIAAQVLCRDSKLSSSNSPSSGSVSSVRANTGMHAPT